MVIEADMSDNARHPPFVLEVWSENVGDDPSIRVFRAKLETPKLGDVAGLIDPSVWTEGFGSVEALQAYLQALNTLFFTFGWSAPLVGWDYPKHWGPRRIRWTIAKLPQLGDREELDASGQVIEI